MPEQLPHAQWVDAAKHTQTTGTRRIHRRDNRDAELQIGFIPAYEGETAEHGEHRLLRPACSAQNHVIVAASEPDETHSSARVVRATMPMSAHR